MGKQIAAAVGAKILGGGYSYGKYDITALIEAPDDVTMAAVALAIAAGGAVKSSQDHAAAERGPVGCSPEESSCGQRSVPGRPVGTLPIGPATAEPALDQLTLRCYWQAARVEHSPGRFALLSSQSLRTV